MMPDKILDDASLDILFREARTHRTWLDKDVPDALLQAIYELARLGPTEANSHPMRVVFVKSHDAKERLKPLLDSGNVKHTMAAPVTAIIGYDKKFYENMPKLFPGANAKSWYESKDNTVSMLRSAALGGAYLIMAARALGLDCGPMSGFNAAGATEEFFKGTDIQAYFLINIGYGDASGLRPRQPRLTFEEACRIL